MSKQFRNRLTVSIALLALTTLALGTVGCGKSDGPQNMVSQVNQQNQNTVSGNQAAEGQANTVDDYAMQYQQKANTLQEVDEASKEAQTLVKNAVQVSRTLKNYSYTYTDNREQSLGDTSSTYAKQTNGFILNDVAAPRFKKVSNIKVSSTGEDDFVNTIETYYALNDAGMVVGYNKVAETEWEKVTTDSSSMDYILQTCTDSPVSMAVEPMVAATSFKVTGEQEVDGKVCTMVEAKVPLTNIVKYLELTNGTMLEANPDIIANIAGQQGEIVITYYIGKDDNIIYKLIKDEKAYQQAYNNAKVEEQSAAAQVKSSVVEITVDKVGIEEFEIPQEALDAAEGEAN